ncbi:hypothetical protein EVA_03941 [gut metagenome]|uniref:Uncharacterized protein n=1 Tax=gut metagenome TaxID=749906 RepID=J9GXU5_9ZZZZ
MVTLNLELTLQTVDNDIQVKLTHTRNHRLTALFVSLHSESGVFLSQLRQALRELIKILLSLGLNCNTDNGIREVHRLENNRSRFVAKRITSADILETNASTNITSADNLYRILVVRVHLEKTRYTFLLTRTNIVSI